MNEVVLFIHSTGTSSQLWANVPTDAIEGRAMVHPANLGYPPHEPVLRGQTVTIADESAHLLEAISEVSGPVHIVAHSYGATVALALAESPTLRGRLASMVLAEPVVFGSLVADHGGEVTAVDADAVSSARAFVTNSVLSHEEKGGSTEWLEVFIDYWNRPGTWLRMPDAQKQQTIAIGWKMFQEVRSCFSADKPFRDYAIDVPTTLILGARTTAHSRAMTHALARTHSVRLVELAGTGHMAPITHPALVHPAIAEHFAALP